MKKILICTGIILVVMFLMPLIAVKVISGDCGMGLCFILFFAVDPALSFGMGIYSGFDIRKMWYIPLVVAVAFVLSSWIIFEMGEPDFFIYAGAYLIIGAVAMLITYAVRKMIKR